MAGLPQGFTLEPEQPAAPPAPALPKGFKLEDPTPAPANDAWPGVVGQDGKPLPPEGGYGKDLKTGEWGMYGGTSFTPEPTKVSADQAQWEGLKSAALAHGGDELEGFAGAVGNKIGTALGMNRSNADFWDIYDQIANRARQQRDAAYDQHPEAYFSGFAPGMLLSGGVGAESLAATKLPRLAQLAILGGGQGAVNGFLGADDQNFLNRLGSGLEGGAEGAVLAPVADVGLRGIGGAAKRVVGTVMPSGPNGGLNALADRVDLSPAEMRAAAANMRGGGVEPRLVDVVGDEGRGVVRDAAAKNTPGRGAVIDAANETYAAAPERIADQARKISPSKQTARQASSPLELSSPPEAEADQAGSSPRWGVDYSDVGNKVSNRSKEALMWWTQGGHSGHMPPEDFTREEGAQNLAIVRHLVSEGKTKGGVLYRAVRNDPATGGPYPDTEELTSWTPDKEYAQQIGEESGGDYTILQKEVPQGAQGFDITNSSGEVVETILPTRKVSAPNPYKSSTPPDQYVEGIRRASETPAAIQSPRGGKLIASQPDYEDVGDTHILHYERPDGSSVMFTAKISPDGTAEIDVPSGSASPNTFSVHDILDAMAAMKQWRPDIVKFTGERISGAGAGRMQSVPAPSETQAAITRGGGATKPDSYPAVTRAGQDENGYYTHPIDPVSRKPVFDKKITISKAQAKALDKEWTPILKAASAPVPKADASLSDKLRHEGTEDLELYISEVGLDAPDADAVVAELRRRGRNVSEFYPSPTGETPRARPTERYFGPEYAAAQAGAPTPTNENSLPEPIAASKAEGDSVIKNTTARQIAAQVDEEQKAMGPRFDAVRDKPVALTPDMVATLSKAQSRAALRIAAKWLPPEEENKVVDFIRTLSSASKIDPRMPPPIRQQIMDKLFQGKELTVDIIDKWARAINQSGEASGMSGLAKDMVKSVRGVARSQYPEYDQALNDYAAQARVGDAARGEGNFENTDFLSTPPDQYVEGIRRASETPAAVVDPATGQPTVSEADALAARARDSVVDAARKGQGQGALPVARQIAYGPAQQVRNAAQIGGANARALGQGMASEVSRVENMRAIDPRAGTQPRVRGEGGDAIVDGFAHAASAASGGKWHIVRVAARWLAQGGIRNVDAERLSRDAVSTDPAKVNAAIDYLEQRGMRRDRAKRFVGVLASSLASRAVTSPPEAPPPPPSSVRGIYRGTNNAQSQSDQP